MDDSLGHVEKHEPEEEDTEIECSDCNKEEEEEKVFSSGVGCKIYIKRVKNNMDDTEYEMEILGGTADDCIKLAEYVRENKLLDTPRKKNRNGDSS